MNREATTDLVKVAVAVIERRCDEKLSVSAVAAEVGVSTRTLQRRLARAETDFTTLIQRARARRAGALLLRGHSVREVARSCGYESCSHFSAVVFPSWYCLSPTEFTRAIRLYRSGLLRTLPGTPRDAVDTAALMARRVRDREGSDGLAQRLGAMWPNARTRFVAAAEQATLGKLSAVQRQASEDS